ncbi:MAG: calcium-binding protein [Phycisphaerae bacterium]
MLQLGMGLGLWSWLCAAAWAGGPGDFDGDSDIDFADFEQFADCQLGPDATGDDECLEVGDYDFDDDLDMHDLAALQRCVSGSGVPASPTCFEHIARIENGCLTIIGTAADSLVALRLRAGAPNVLDVDLDNNGSADFSFGRAHFTCITIHARGGDDVIFFDESNGAFTDTEAATIFAGRGEDTLLGGSGGEIFIGGPGNDTVFMGPGSDRFIWNPGDGVDTVEGGEGTDTAQVEGDVIAEDFTVTANGTRVRFDRVSAAAFFLDLNACERLTLNMNAGNDSLACTGNLAALIQITADGGAGDDRLLGSNGADLLTGGDDDDFIDGQQGSDVAFLGAGDDTFQWDPGDGNDTVEGQLGFDAIQFNGSNSGEIFDFAANGSRLRFTRNIAAIVLDAAGVELFNLSAFGSIDVANVNELNATDVQEVSIDLGGFGAVADAAADTVNVLGTAAADTFELFGEGGLTVVQRGTSVRVKGYEGLDQVAIAGVGADLVRANGTDGDDVMTVTANGTAARIDAPGFSAGVNVSGALSLVMKGHDGDDQISCTGNLAALVPITLDGGAGDDTLLGSNGGDVLLGGDDNDFVDGQQGSDVALLGAGDDTFQWDPGDGNDVIEGQIGFDTLQFNGSNGSEIIEFSANGVRLRCTRNLGNIILDVDGVEQANLAAAGGTDTVTLNDLTPTAIEQVNVNLALFGGAVDAAADTININGSDQPDTMQVTADGAALNVLWPAGSVRISASEATLDTLNVNGLGGNDNITAGAGTTSLIRLFLNQ